MKVMLKKVRVAFTQALLVPADYQDNKVFRRSATLLVAPGSENDKAIWAAIKSVCADVYGKKADATLEGLKGNSNKFCYQDGKTKAYDGFEGMWFTAAHRKVQDGPPLLLDSDKSHLIHKNEQGTPILDESNNIQWVPGKEGRIYAGCYVNASVDIYAQAGQNAGVRCSLIALQFHSDGDSFSGAAKSSGDEFEDLGTGADADAEFDALA